MPSLFLIGSLRVYFWSNESGEPIHVHVSRGKPTPNSTKIWLTADGHCVLASNGSQISRRDLERAMEVIASEFEMICEEWRKYFLVEEIKFYC